MEISQLIRRTSALAELNPAAGSRNHQVIEPHDIQRALDRVREWVEKYNYRGYEPFDGLTCWARRFTYGNQLAERLLQQLIRQCPFNRERRAPARAPLLRGVPLRAG